MRFPGHPHKLRKEGFREQTGKKKYSRLDRHLMGIGIVFLLPAAILIIFTTWFLLSGTAHYHSVSGTAMVRWNLSA